ncbi:CcoQ/FixQ family Cbb3-type cytochrome c oxidase assembly chaperone [Nitrospirota bacterium]
MSIQAIFYFIFGLSMVIALGVAIFHYYGKGQRKEVEEAKYRMLNDDDE